jgi:hypothetical protein
MKARMMNSVIMALLCGALWWKIGNGETFDIVKYNTP